MRWLLGVVLASWCLVSAAGGSVSNDIKQVKAEHEQRLLAIPGVVSIGVGLGQDGNPAIIVGLEEDDPAISEQIPTELDGHAVIIRQVGTMEAQ